MNKTALTAVIALALVGLVLVSGCLGTSDDTTDGDNNNLTDGTATTDQLMGELDQNLIDEDDTVEIGDMV